MLSPDDTVDREYDELQSVDPRLKDEP